jgi:hypothetical protein
VGLLFMKVVGIPSTRRGDMPCMRWVMMDGAVSGITATLARSCLLRRGMGMDVI